MIENPRISELQTNAIVAGASGHGSFAGGGKTSSWTSCAGFVLGGVDSKFFARGNSHRETCIYTLFQRSTGPRSPYLPGGPVLCPTGPPCPCRVPVAMSVFMTHSLMGWTVSYKSSLLSCAEPLQSPTPFSHSESLQNDGARTG
jgi:hypothetical protein